VIYLFDVNALLALAVIDHQFHVRSASWAESSSDVLATCSIVELGFVRVLAQTPVYGFSLGQACSLLERLKKRAGSRFTFIPDAHDISRLPGWVRTPKQITDGHLSGLARANGAVLATLDENIPDSFVIPK